MIDLHTLVRQAGKEKGAIVKTAPKALNLLTMRDVLRLHTRDRSMNGVDETWLKIQLQAVIDGRPSLLGPYEGVDGAWRGEPAFVVGGSYNLRAAFAAGFRFSMLKGFHTIGVNHVVEDYHDFEWFLFQDARFLTKTKYDLMKRFRGRIFGHLRTRLKPSDRVTIFYTQDDGPSENVVQGLYTFLASGITAVSLALCSGADPVYLMGVDTGGLRDDHSPAHYKDDYPGEILRAAHWGKYLKTIPERMLRYAPYAERFRNVDPMGAITVFKKIGVTEIPELKKRLTA